MSYSVGLSMGGIRSLAHLVSPIVVRGTMCVCQTTPPPDLALACNNRCCPLAAATRNSHDLAAARYPYSRIAQDAFRKAARRGATIDSQPQAPNACRPVRSSSSRRTRGRREVCNQQFSEAVREENRFVWEFCGNESCFRCSVVTQPANLLRCCLPPRNPRPRHSLVAHGRVDICHLLHLAVIREQPSERRAPVAPVFPCVVWPALVTGTLGCRRIVTESL